MEIKHIKYQFKYVPDTEGEGFQKKYLEATSTINPDSKYYLEVDYDLCAPVETWTLYHSYEGFPNGLRDAYHQQVYHGRELTAEQVDFMVDLVMEIEYLNFNEFIK